jgi:hypothetical protein
LPSGTIAVFADGGFAGESILARMKPKEVQVLEFGRDLDVELAEKTPRTTDETRMLSFENGELVEHFLRHHSLGYEIENRSGSDRLVSIELDLVNNAEVEGADELSYDSRSAHALAGFAVPKKSVQTRELSATEGLVVRHDAKALTVTMLERLAGHSAIAAKQQRIVRDALALARERDAARRNRTGWQAVLSERNAEIERLRANARAVGASASEDIVARLLEIEDETKKIRRYVATFAARASERDRRILGTLARL